VTDAPAAPLAGPARHAAVLAEALHGCARAATRAQLFAGLDALAAGPLGSLGVTLFLAGPDQVPRVVHSGGTAINTPGAAPSPAFMQVAMAATTSQTPMTLRALDTMPGARDDARLRAILDAGVRAIACIPFRTPRTTPGLLSVRYARDEALDEAEIDLLRDVALLVALCLERVDAARPAPVTTLSEADRRQRHMALLGELVPAVIHDLNNPLTGISAFAELLESEISEPDQRESVGYIRREAQQAARLLKDLQVLARPAGADTLVEVNQLVESAVRLRGYLLRSAGATLRVTLEPGMPPVSGDTQALLQLLMHLLARAETVVRQAEPSSRVVEITTIREPHVAVVHVTDTGPGMSPEALARMFDLQPQADANAPAAGVGLAIAKAIVEAHGGTLAADGGPDKPTRIEVRLPLPPISDSRSPASR
jgi:signal transduction histidine kinase